MATTSELHHLFEFESDEVDAAEFTANGEHVVGGTGIQVRRVADGKQVATMQLKDNHHIRSVTVSRDGKWIAAASYARVYVWDTVTCEQVIMGVTGNAEIGGVNFSPDSTRLVSADSWLCTATIWDIAARGQVRQLHLADRVFAAKYSPQGDQIATATGISIRLWDSNDGQSLATIRVGVRRYNSLLWFKNTLYVLTVGKTIKQIDAASGSTIWEWPVAEAGLYSCIALPQHGKFKAHSTEKTITFWDTATHSPRGLIQNIGDIHSIALSLDGRLLVITTKEKAITMDRSYVTFSSVSEPELRIGNTALEAWKHGQLTDAEALLTAEIPKSESGYHVFASRALVRARLENWDAALVDAEESITIQPSLVGYIAKGFALVGKGEKDKGIRMCDIAFLWLPSDFPYLPLLIKAVVLFLAGEHVDALSRMDDLITITDPWIDPALYVIQAYMLLLCGNTRMEIGDYERAIQLFEDARIKLPNCTRQPPLIVSLISGWSFDVLAITIQQRLCEVSLVVGCAKEASESMLRMVAEDVDIAESMKTWVSDFRTRCRRKLEDLGDGATNVKRYDEAISQYTAALSLDLADRQDLLLKRSKVRTYKGEWEAALNDAREAIEFDPSSSSGYEIKYAVLPGMGHHGDAMDTFEMMLSKISESSDPEIRERSRRYVSPRQTKEAICTSIQHAICDSPLVLINTLSGRLCDKSEQAAAFESTLAFATLVTSMTTHIDHALIERVVSEFYRYATFSHTWEGNEPLYDKVVKVVVYDLEAFPTHEKLRMFCKIVRDKGFNWAWSDTCCIDKGNNFVLQEALVSMFKWYEGSAMTVIFLCDVDELAEIGALMKSRWNSRAWTFQEYHASKVVRIYTKDWTPYLGLTIYNHKESPEIISEMEKATGISAQALTALRPGLTDVREKLRLASARQTTRVEDTAYSLLGIFSMTLPVTYGEGDKALGRLLSQLLMSSGDTSILAWTGKPGSFNSCLPTSIVVFGQPLISHIPPTLPDAEMEAITSGLHASELDHDLVTRLYDEVDRLPTPNFAGQRMRLPCLAFEIRAMSPFQNGSEFIFCVQAGVLGAVEIKTRQNLVQLSSLYLVHP